MILGGLDVGRFTDRTALVGLEGDVVGEAHLLSGLPFREQAEALGPVLARYRLVLVDVTGLGIGLYERLAEAGHPVVATTLGDRTGQPRIHWESERRHVRGVHVGKTYLIGRMMGLIHARELTVAPWCCHRESIRRELGQLTTGFTRRGGLTISARKGHDDLALALSLAILARDLASRLVRGEKDEPAAAA